MIYPQFVYISCDVISWQTAIAARSNCGLYKPHRWQRIKTHGSLLVKRIDK